MNKHKARRLIGLFLLWTAAAIPYTGMAQCGKLSAVSATTESRCVATGTITITATGGEAPETYEYKIVSGPVTTNYTSSNVLTGLPPGNYSVIVRDAVSNCSVTLSNIIVTGNYTVPSLVLGSTGVTCMNGTDGKIFIVNASNGRQPYSYQIIAPSASHQGEISGSGTFTNLKAGTYLIRMTDSCGGIQTRSQVVSNYTWTFRGTLNIVRTCKDINVNISLTNSNGVNSPNAVFNGFIYGISTKAGDTTWYHSSTFTYSIGTLRSATIVVKDPCGNIQTLVWKDSAKPSVDASVSKSNMGCTTFTATITGQTNFNKNTVEYCLYDSTNTILIAGCQNQPVFSNIRYGKYVIRINDRCYDTTILRTVEAQKPVPSVASAMSISYACNSYTITVNGQTNLNDPRFCLFENGSRTSSGCNSTGIFTHLSYGVNYCIEIKNNATCYDTVIRRCFTVSRPIPSLSSSIQFSSFTCEGAEVRLTGQRSISNPEYCLYDSKGIQLVCNTTGIFSNLARGTYCIRFKNDPACYDTIIERCFTVEKQKPSAGAVLISNKTCSFFTASVGNMNNFLNPVYQLFDGTNKVQIGSNQSSPIFAGLSYGSYCIRIKNDSSCYDTIITRCFNVSPPRVKINLTAQKTCTSPGTTNIAVSIAGGTSPLSVTLFGAFNNPLSTVVITGTTYTFKNYSALEAGQKYKVVVSDSCGNKDSASVVPNYYYINRAVKLTTRCPAGSSPNGSGDIQLVVTENRGGDFSTKIIQKDGTQFTQVPTSSTNAGRTSDFVNLAAGTYIFDTYSNDCNKHVYDTVVIPKYVYPTISSANGIVCDKGGQMISLALDGGRGPYQYQIFQAKPSNPDITTAYQNSPFFSLNNGTIYSLVRIRAMDACGNATITDVGHQPPVNPVIFQQGSCSRDTMSLSVDSITGAVYTWYKRSYHPFDSVKIGTGNTLHLTSYSAADTGYYICKVSYNNGCAVRTAYKTLWADCVILPLAMDFFTAVPAQQHVLLNWKVLTGKEILHYTVEWSNDGKKYYSIGIVPASDRSNYQFVHTSPIAGTNYYRLNVLLQEGKRRYSDVRKVMLATDERTIVYPNPVSSEVHIRFGKQLTSGACRIMLYNAEGKLVSEKQKGVLVPNETISVQHVPPGKYVLLISSKTETISQIIEIVR